MHAFHGNIGVIGVNVWRQIHNGLPRSQAGKAVSNSTARWTNYESDNLVNVASSLDDPKTTANVTRMPDFATLMC
jgi:hypothetical protein